jgi:hypothetical protein
MLAGLEASMGCRKDVAEDLRLHVIAAVDSMSSPRSAADCIGLGHGDPPGQRVHKTGATAAKPRRGDRRSDRIKT